MQLSRTSKILIFINTFLLSVALCFGFKMLTYNVARMHEKYTAEQFQAKTLKITNIGNLQKLVISDDKCFRANETLARIIRIGFSYLCFIAVLTSLVNLAFIFVDASSHTRIINTVLIIAFVAYIISALTFSHALDANL